MKYSKTAPVKIVVLGAGGTGGYVIPHLYRLGYASEHPTRIIVCDGDVVEQKNLIRQNFVEQDIGRNKAQALAARYAAAFGIECEYRPEFIETQEELHTLTEPDRVPYLPMDIQGANLFFQLIARRYEKTSTVFTSNKTFSQWNEVFADVTIASAILDRVLHHCTVINIKGESYRLKERKEFMRQKQQIVNTLFDQGNA